MVRGFRVDMSHPAHIPMRVRTSHSFPPPFRLGDCGSSIHRGLEIRDFSRSPLAYPVPMGFGEIPVSLD